MVLEIIFRILPTSSPLPLRPVINESEILTFYPNQETTISLGSTFYKVVKKTTNNYGFYSNFDYYPNSEPDIVIIGDSYVEAAQIRNSDSIGEKLLEKNPKLNVYQIGISGFSLSQYIKVIRYAKQEFSPRHYVVIVVGNDFDESICNESKKEGIWCFNSEYQLSFVPFKGYSSIRMIARNSAFLRYIVFNLGIDLRDVVSILFPNNQDRKRVSEFAGNTQREKTEEIRQASYTVINRFFEELVKMDLNERVTLIIDADRQDIYNNRSTESYFSDMRTFMIEAAIINGVSYIDMNPVFKDAFLKKTEKFEFPTDGHWNERAHDLAAQELLKQLSK